MIFLSSIKKFHLSFFIIFVQVLKIQHYITFSPVKEYLSLLFCKVLTFPIFCLLLREEGLNNILRSYIQLRSSNRITHFILYVPSLILLLFPGSREEGKKRTCKGGMVYWVRDGRERERERGKERKEKEGGREGKGTSMVYKKNQQKRK